MSFSVPALRKMLWPRLQLNWSGRSTRDAVVILAVVIVSYALSEKFDLFNALIRFHEEHGDWGIDDIVMASLIGSMALVVYGWRRLQDLAQENAARRLAESEVANQIGQLRRVNQRFKTALDNMPHGLVMFDREQHLIICNRRYADMYGIPDEYTAPGTSFRAIIESRTARYSDDAAANMARGLEIVSCREETIVETSLTDGRTLAFAWHPMQEGGWVAIHQDITDRKRIEKSLAEASEAKSRFLATMSHEIRTPMNAILGLADVLLDTSLGDDQRKTVQIMRDAGNNLLRIINDVLDFSKLERGHVELESIPFAVTELLDGVIAMYEPHATAKGVAIRRSCDVNLPAALRGDPTRIRQVLLNLMSNAVKFTERGSITLNVRCERVTQTGATIKWQVQDTGIGIARDRVDELFKDFAQARASISREYGGSGLGLAICKRLIELMGGEIQVLSAPGEGSTFSFNLTLPFAEVPAKKGGEVVEYGAIGALVSRLGRPMRLLVTDDNAMNRLVVVKMLAPFDIEIDEADDGRKAVDAISRRSYDVVVMDVRMPVMDGLEATRAIRGLRGPKADVPIIALTANAYGEDIENCRAAGMTDFLAKPARKQDLIDAIVRATNTTAHGSEPKEASAASPTPRSVSFDAAALFDREVFNDFATSVGADAANEVIAVFVRDAETRLKTLQELSCASDRERIRSEAHSLKGEAATLGLLALSRLARALEQGAPTIDAEEYRNIVGSLDSTFELSRPHLPGPMTASDGGGRALRA